MRLYEMFMGPLETTKPWSMQGVEGISRFLNRPWRMIVDEAEDDLRLSAKVVPDEDPHGRPTVEQLRALHKTIPAVTEDVEALRFNTSISRLMEFVNYFTGQEVRPLSCMETFVLLLSRLAPHIAEELWHVLGHSESLAYAPWPELDEKFTREDAIEMPIHINGKIRGRIIIPISAGEEELKKAALSDSRVLKYLEGRTVRKIIIVPKKLVNVVVG